MTTILWWPFGPTWGPTIIALAVIGLAAATCFVAAHLRQLHARRTADLEAWFADQYTSTWRQDTREEVL